MFLRHQTFVVVLLLVLLCFVVTGVNAAKPPPKKEIPKQPTSRINIDLLPPLQDVLADLGFTPFLRQFVRLGVTETRLLLKLTAMDFQIMTMEWDDFTNDHVAQLKNKIKQLTELATVVVEPIREDLIARNKTIYGRLYLPLGVQSIEFNVASFGGRIPMGEVPLQMGETLFECPPPEPTEGSDNANDAQPPRTPPSVVYNGQLVVVVRGNCTFLQKALYLKERGARGMLVVNTEDKLESLASGVGINKTVTEQQVASLGSFFIIATSNNSYISLKKFLEWPLSTSTGIHLVPLKCALGGACAPLTPEEKQLQAEVSWGSLRLSSPSAEKETFEFLTSNYGAPLPDANTPLRLDTHLLHATDGDGYTAKQRLLCEPISSPESVAFALDSNSSFLEIAHVPARQTDGVFHALIAERGGCSFDTKTFHAQQAGYRLLILVNMATPATNGLAAPLQRIGGINPSVGRVGIPTLLVLPEVAAHVKAAGRDAALQVTVDVARNDSGFEHWTDVAYTRWSNDPEEKKIQLQMLQQKYQEHATLVRWLQAQVETLTPTTTTTTAAEANSHAEL